MAVSDRKFSAIVFIIIVILFVGVVFIPNNTGHRTSPANACINNLRMIDAAKQQWALDHNKGPAAMPIWKDINPYLGRGAEFQSTNCPLRCPSGGNYTIGAISNPPTCTIPGHVLPP